MIGEHNSNIDRSFYNDRVRELISANEIAELFTYVPITAGHMELVGGNVVAFGKIKEGYDIIDILVDADLYYTDISLENPIIPMVIYPKQQSIVISYPDIPEGQLPTPYDHAIRTIRGVLLMDIPFKISTGDYYYVVIKNENEGINITGSYLVVGGDSRLDVANGLSTSLRNALTAIGKDPDEIQIDSFPLRLRMFNRQYDFDQQNPYEAGDINTVFTQIYPFLAPADPSHAYILSVGNTVKYPVLKCGATHDFGIVYKDNAARQCSVMKSSDFRLYVPFYTENDDALLEAIPTVNFKIYHRPPAWASTYEIVYYGNMSMDWFMQLRATAITNISGDRYAIDIQETIDYTRAQNSRWKIADYAGQWQEGDRIRLIGTIDAVSGVVTKYGIGDEVIYDYEIEQVGDITGDIEADDWLLIQAVDHPAAFAGQVNILVEIYRPRKGLANTIPYGSGMVFEIGTDENGRRYHKGDVDQVLDAAGQCTTAGEVENKAHDAYKFMRLNYKNASTDIQPFFAESLSPSDWWSWIVGNTLTNKGFPFLDDLSQKQTVLDERIRHGGKIITGTRTNNIAHFTYLDFLDLPKKNGDITALREVGYVLKVLQLHKETSIYIERIQTFNADGTPEYTLSNKFLGTVYPLETDYGCQHPDSVMVNGRTLYYWDHNQGKFIRSAPNGQLVLDVKTKRWYKELLSWVSANGGAKVLEVRTGMNIDHDEVWLSFRIGETATGLIFNEKDGRYKSRIDVTTESYIHLGAFFAHLYRQRLWIMNIDEGQDYLSWAGEDTYAIMELVSNIDVAKNKVFTAVALYSDHQWTSLPKTVVIPEEASAVNEIMESNISVWDRREGIFYGAILKDENSKGNFVSTFDKKMNGREMRGRNCFIKLRTDEHGEKVRLDSIIVFSTHSERSA
jgi:hypothetical protein